MPCPHHDIKIVQRSNRQSAVAAAAYQSGERLFSEYDQKQKYYAEKRGIVHTEIILPPHAPRSYADRNTLWNAAEAVEKQWNSQLARRLVLAIPREIPTEQHADLIRDYCREFFVSKGMIADFAIHDKGDGNPHAHILLTIQAMDETGKWLPKSRKVYDLDENGQRIRLPSGNWKSHKEDIVDWNDQKYGEIWRQGWAATANRYLEANDRPERLDLRSYERQGLDLLPTVHEGPAVRQMEARGIATDKGDLNRWIKATNALLNDLKRRIAALFGWLNEVREELSKPQAPTLADLLGAYYGARNAGAWSNKGKVGNLQKFADTVNYLTEQKLYTVDDLEARVTSHSERIEEWKASMGGKRERMEELKDLLEQAERYRERKPIYDQMNAIHRQGQREKFKAAHEGELRQFYMARRKLKDHFTPEGKLPLAKWRAEYGQLQQAYQEEYAAYKPIREDLMKLYQVKSTVDTARRQQEQTQHRDRDMEL